MSTIREWTNALVLAGDRATSARWVQTRPPFPSPKTSLLAVVCDNAELQKRLPQVWLPRTRQGRTVAWRIRAKYMSVRRPQEIWMASQGVVAGVLMRSWLPGLHGVVRAWNPAVRMVLAIDVCRAHTS